MEPDFVRPTRPEYIPPSYFDSPFSRDVEGRIVRDDPYLKTAMKPLTYSDITGLAEKTMDSELFAKTLPDKNWIEAMLGQNVGQPVAVECKDEFELRPENILHTVARMKNMLNSKTKDMRIKYTECYMTDRTKDMLVRAAKRLKQYGKTPPVIACFDEYGQRVGEKIHDELLYGMTVNIVSPEKMIVSHDYIRLQAIPY